MNRISFLLVLVLPYMLFYSCSKEDKEPDPVIPDVNTDTFFIRGADISAFPKIEQSNPVFYNQNNEEQDFITILKNSGVNTARIRLWVNPDEIHSGFNEVNEFATNLASQGFRIWLTLHYSDTWADPGNQNTPADWQNLSSGALKDSVYHYTQRVVNIIDPDYIQIGNEINGGILFPYGQISSNPDQFFEILKTGVRAVRDASSKAKIIIHYAGLNNPSYFFGEISTLSYDFIGISYYPAWHGRSLENLKAQLESLYESSKKPIVIAETAYPFTLGWNDWTNNIIGLEEHLVPDYDASPAGQKKFMNKISEIMKDLNKGKGYCYWGAELIAFDGPTSSNGSPWENQALFDFDNKALPVLDAFSQD
jgi:arabinogalactan endo-1,4-beta-galactosidase